MKKDWLEIHNPSSPRNYIEKGDFTLVAQTPTHGYTTGDSVFSAICTISRTSVSFAFSYCIHPHPTESRVGKNRFEKKKKSVHVQNSIYPALYVCVCVFGRFFFFPSFFFTFVRSVEIRKIRLKFFFVSFRRDI